MRNEEDIGPTPLEHEEAAFTSFVTSGGAQTFLQQLNDTDDFEAPRDGLDNTQKEVLIHKQCSEYHARELRA